MDFPHPYLTNVPVCCYTQPFAIKDVILIYASNSPRTTVSMVSNTARPSLECHANQPNAFSFLPTCQICWFLSWRVARLGPFFGRLLIMARGFFCHQEAAHASGCARTKLLRRCLPKASLSPNNFAPIPESFRRCIDFGSGSYRLVIKTVCGWLRLLPPTFPLRKCPSPH